MALITDGGLELLHSQPFDSGPQGLEDARLVAAALGDCTGLAVLDLGGGTGCKLFRH